MSDRIDAWNAPQITPAKPRPAEPLWTATKDAQRVDAQLAIKARLAANCGCCRTANGSPAAASATAHAR